MAKINILYKTSLAPWGGGNQFLKSLTGYFKENGVYSGSPEESDAIIFNSHHELFKLIWLKFRFPSKVFVHRLDNLMFLIRGHGRDTDKLIIVLNDKIADGTVFQSQWCRQKFYEFGIKPSKYAAVIHNAPDPGVFFVANPKDREKKDGKIKLIATSWSDNPRKGFLLYSYLDERLDFSKYSMTFVGRSPVSFKNIRQFGPLSSSRLAEILREHDIFISGSLNEACSNSVIEAMHCGLVPVVINSGANKELIGNQGVLFEDIKDALAALDNAADNLEDYRSRMRPETISQVGQDYFKFCESVLEGNAKKNLDLFSFLYLSARVFSWRIKERIKSLGYYQWLSRKNAASVRKITGSNV